MAGKSSSGPSFQAGEGRAPFPSFVFRFKHSKLQISHAGTVVPECFKDDNASQWKSGKFDPRSLRNP